MEFKAVVLQVGSLNNSLSVTWELARHAVLSLTPDMLSQKL